jgi:hypothetical protein
LQIAPGSCVKREIVVHGIDHPVSAEITADGITFWVKGSPGKRVFTGWRQIVQAGHAGTDVPASLLDKPVEFLQYQATKARKSPK